MRIEEKKLVELTQSVNTNNRNERDFLEEKYQSRIHVNRTLNRKLVSFQANKDKPFYRWFAYREGFSIEMVKMLIEDSHKKSGQILDPFAGAGTTLFASREMGFDSMGIELLPIGEFVFRSRLAAESISSDRILDLIKEIKSLDFSRLPVDEQKSFRHVPITEKAFPSENERKLNAFVTYVNKISDSAIQQTLRFACFCILEKISYTSKDGQFLRWDKRANKGKEDFNKGKIYSFDEAILEQLSTMAEDVRNKELFNHDRNEKHVSTVLKTGSSLEILPTLEDESFDLVITSPPYCNRYDYTRTYALDLVYLGVNDDGIKNLRQQLLSCTVENREKTEFIRAIYKKNGRLSTFDECEKAFYSVGALQEVLSILRKYLDQKLLNNTGIYRLVRNYFYEHTFVIFELARLLRDSGRVYYVNDNVRYAGENIPVDLILSEFAEKAGLSVKKISILEKTKGNSSQQMGVFGRQTLRKCVYQWDKN